MDFPTESLSFCGVLRPPIVGRTTFFGVISTLLNDALLIFSRYPRLGQVKTRLSSVLSPAGCLQLHQALLLDTLDRTASLNLTRSLFLADCSHHEMWGFAQKHNLPHTVQMHCQEGKDLGERMWNAYKKVYRTSDQVVFLGADTPSLPVSHIKEALVKLSQFPVVAGPVEDGGYYLLALSQPRRELFQNIPWGTAVVLQETLARLAPHEFFLLPRWYDVDTVSDLRRLEQDLSTQLEGFPALTHEFLQSRLASPISRDTDILGAEPRK